MALARGESVTADSSEEREAVEIPKSPKKLPVRGDNFELQKGWARTHHL